MIINIERSVKSKISEVSKQQILWSHPVYLVKILNLVWAIICTVWSQICRVVGLEVERKIFLLNINLSFVCWIKTPAKLGPFSIVAWGIFCVSVTNNNCWVRTCQKKKFKIKVRYHFGQVSEWFGVNYWTALRLKTEVLFKTKQKWQRIWQLWWVWSLLFRGQLSCSQQDWKNIWWFIQSL